MFLDSKDEYSSMLSEYYKNYASKCNKCNGTGIIRNNSDSCLCDCQKAAIHNVSLIKNGFPKKIIDTINWEYVLNRYGNDASKIKKYSADVDKYGNIVLMGKNNVEINELEAILAISVKDRSTITITISSLLQLLSDFNTKNNTINKLTDSKSSTMLIINNFNGEIEQRYKSLFVIIEEILYKRICNGQITILSTSLTKDRIVNRYGDSFAELLKGYFSPVTMKHVIKEMKNELFESEDGELYD